MTYGKQQPKECWKFCWRYYTPEHFTRKDFHTRNFFQSHGSGKRYKLEANHKVREWLNKNPEATNVQYRKIWEVKWIMW